MLRFTRHYNDIIHEKFIFFISLRSKFIGVYIISTEKSLTELFQKYDKVFFDSQCTSSNEAVLQRRDNIVIIQYALLHFSKLIAEPYVRSQINSARGKAC